MVGTADVLDRGSGPAFVCLHGFPQNMSAWDQVADHLVAAGFRVIAPNMRGYRSASELGPRQDYTSTKLAEDVLAILSELEVSEAAVVGHDLGASVAWEVARIAPKQVTRIFSLAAPHPAAFVQACLSSAQLLRAWYVLGAQSTALALKLFSPRDAGSARRLVTFLSERGLVSPEVDRYLDYLRSDHRFESALRWYQAMPLNDPRSVWTKAEVPATVIWGKQDPFTNGRSVDLTCQWTNSTCSVHRLPDAGHWLLDYNAKPVSEILIEDMKH
ncbi:alpha/beta fold hydrolase [Kribbella sindirgiensis]|uniref:Alpha/beta hydrolase n=1 Tax=Kribbella sindirgiensis TaxID=1124744 RepID=A0A4R0IGJ9_9ACTN|nr:alpha/beta hydrolase [Kribbella sindirgiensis]TCC32461.1 alpha/beta hydrolase [Kribbella sindirgiensis]